MPFSSELVNGPKPRSPYPKSSASIKITLVPMVPRIWQLRQRSMDGKNVIMSARSVMIAITLQTLLQLTSKQVIRSFHHRCKGARREVQGVGLVFISLQRLHCKKLKFIGLIFNISWFISLVDFVVVSQQNIFNYTSKTHSSVSKSSS